MEDSVLQDHGFSGLEGCHEYKNWEVTIPVRIHFEEIDNRHSIGLAVQAFRDRIADALKDGPLSVDVRGLADIEEATP